jgi:predicted metal-binding membrane protein
MEPGKLLLYAGYVISIGVFLCGIIVLWGILLPPYIPQKFRIMFGVVLILYGIYRFITLRLKLQQRNEDSRYL